MDEHNAFRGAAFRGAQGRETTSCVVVTYNSAPWIGRCVTALLASSRPPEQIVVVDNASSDATLEVLATFGEQVEAVALAENTGFGHACNLAASRARGDLLLFLNPDTEVGARALERAARTLARDPDVGVVGGRTTFPDGTLNATCCFREPSLWSTTCRASGLSSLFPRSSALNPELMGGWSRTDDRYVDVVTGCFLMLRRDLFTTLGGFDERFFMYSEDTDLCRRVRATGRRCLHQADVELVHAGGASDSVRAEKLVKVMRAQSQYYAKHWSRARARLGLALLDVSVLTRLVAHLLLGTRTSRAKWRTIWSQRGEWHDVQPVAAPAQPATTDAGPRSLSPSEHIAPAPVATRARMAYRFTRHLARSLRSRDHDFVANAGVALGSLTALTISEPFNAARHECNVCGWTGAHFYPNTGPGYHDFDTTCPGCSCLDRHRDLVALLSTQTDFFEPRTRVVEVAPMRGFEHLVRRQAGVDYTSFDLTRRAMEHGDITDMRYETDSVDFFVCLHVLEHVPDEHAALDEIARVLRPGGAAILQVPIDWALAESYDYDAPDPREVGHVRRYGRDFGDRLARRGFQVRTLRSPDVFPTSTIERFGLSSEPIFVAVTPRG